MKNVLFILLGLLFVQTSYAKSVNDQFYIDKDGRRYLCRAVSNGSPSDPSDCVNHAYSGPFSKSESIELCSGANSISPATCARKAYSGPFSKSESIDLCTRAYDDGPADCARTAYSGPFSKEESVRLCRRTGSVARADCARKAYSGPYSKEESISLCLNASPALIMRSLDLLHAMPQSQSLFQKIKINLGLK